jgi:hypothetical protein
MQMLLLLSVAIAVLAPAPAASQPPRTPVVVELFTSEGCSSCPAADALLAHLATQPLDGIEVVALSFHVTYWDRLGWKDPFSSAAATRRQAQYAAAIFGDDRIYTPQMVIDGVEEFTGSDERRAVDAIRKAAALPHVPLRVTAQARGSELRLSVDAPAAPSGQEKLDIVIALVEDNLTSIVRRGENGGRTLVHSAVVRKHETIGALERDAFVADGAWKLDPAWRRDALRVIAFLQDQKTRRIYGAAMARVQQAGGQAR